MTSNRTSQTLVLEDGRRLGFAEFGPPEGRPVLHFHGSSASRLERPPSERMLFRRNVRLVSVDRPGHGLSDFVPGRRVVDWPDDVRALTRLLGIDEFWVEGYSAGGPYALACASRLPDRVAGVALVSSAAPFDRPGAFEGLPLPNLLLAACARWAPPLVRLIRHVMRRRMIEDAGTSVRQLMSGIPEADRETLGEPEAGRLFAEAVQEGLRQGSRGVAHDDVLIHRSWGFDLGGIRPHVDLWQGDADVNVPPAAAEYLRAALPGADLVLLSGQGHFLIFEHWGEILARLVDGAGHSGG